jgi:hypothetical protein
MVLGEGDARRGLVGISFARWQSKRFVTLVMNPYMAVQFPVAQVPPEAREPHLPRGDCTKRCGKNGVISMLGFPPATISAMTLPMTGPPVMPKWPLPNAKNVSHSRARAERGQAVGKRRPVARPLRDVRELERGKHPLGLAFKSSARSQLGGAPSPANSAVPATRRPTFIGAQANAWSRL